MAKNKNQE